jgi:predicted Rossmann fold nucleotide-binding protein DprA/Smf involved in DNA uptake
MTGDTKRKGDKASQATSNEAAQRQNLRLEVYTETKSGRELFVMGERGLLQHPLLGLLCSRECPGAVILETLDLVPDWVKAGRVVVSGFHSPLEQQVLRSLLRRQAKVVKVLAKALDGYRIPPVEAEAMASGRMLLISAFPKECRRTTRATALARNKLVADMVDELIIPHVAPDGALAAILEARPTSSRGSQ